MNNTPKLMFIVILLICFSLCNCVAILFTNMANGSDSSEKIIGNWSDLANPQLVMEIQRNKTFQVVKYLPRHGPSDPKIVGVRVTGKWNTLGDGRIKMEGPKSAVLFGSIQGDHLILGSEGKKLSPTEVIEGWKLLHRQSAKRRLLAEIPKFTNIAWGWSFLGI